MRTMRKFAAAGAMSVALLAASPAMAANCAPISITSSPATISYNPITASAAATTTFTIAIGAKVAPNTTDYRLIFTDSASNATLRIATSGPAYSILNPGGQTVSFPLNSTAAGQTGVALIPASTTSVTYTVSLPINTTTDFVGGTNYAENLSYSLQCYKSNGGTNGVDTGSLTSLNSTITNVLSVVTASPQTLDFGNFTSATQTLQVGLKSTNSINVAVSTLNSSTMVLAGATPPYNTSNSIPYSMTFNGSTLSSSGTNNVARATVAGSTYPFVMSLTGGVPSGKLAGVYADVITLTFTPGI